MKNVLIFCLGMALAVQAFAQSGLSKQELENKKKKLLKDIQYTQSVLERTKQNKETTMQSLLALRKQIEARENLITTINNESKLLDRQIELKQSSVSELAKQLVQLKKEYAQMLQFAQRNQSAYTKMMFIFSAEDFNQGLKRFKYIQQFNESRKKQVEYILQTQTNLKKNIEELEAQKRSKLMLIEEQEREKEKLDSDKEKKNNLVNDLQSRERTLRIDLDKKNQQVAQLNRAIQDAIQREIEEAKRKAEEEARKKAIASGKPVPKSGTSTSNALTLTPEAQRISDNFAANQNKLPWPVEKGYIIGQFGVHPHPVLSGVKISNNGIDIQTEMNANVRAVFEGEVREVFSIPGQNFNILIGHGEFFTVYTNLLRVDVKKGDKVSAKQALGMAYTVPGKSLTEIHFELWRGTQKLDPALWLTSSGS
jgi:murein hydrolase activator